MSSCLSGAGRAYRFEALDLDMIKSPAATSSWISNSSSPSSTLSESSNSPNSISTRKPRTPRKRPNQTYNEAAAILSTAYPKLFPAKHLSKLTNNNHSFLFELPPPDLLLPFQVRDDNGSGFLQHLQRPSFVIESKGFNFSSFEKACQSPGEIDSQGGVSCEGCTDGRPPDDDFDAQSMLDEEIGEGIDSILGNLDIENEETRSCDSNSKSKATTQLNNFCYGYPVFGCLGFDFGYGMRRELRAFRNVDGGDWWRFPFVNVVDITPEPDSTTLSPPAADKKKKKVEKGGAKTNAPPPSSREDTENENLNSTPTGQTQPSKQARTGQLLLKLNYDGVLDAWSDKASPFSGDDSPAATGNDVQVRLAQIDLFSDNGGIREASVQRYKEKRRTRLFSNSKKIRYQVRKVNADRRPRMKGRFVRTPNAPDD